MLLMTFDAIMGARKTHAAMNKIQKQPEQQWEVRIYKQRSEEHGEEKNQQMLRGRTETNFVVKAGAKKLLQHVERVEKRLHNKTLTGNTIAQRKIPI